MPYKAYVLINVEPGKVRKVVENISKIEGVKEVDAVTGGIDIIAKLEVEAVSGILGVVVNEIHSVKGIKSTSTHIVIEEEE